MDAMGAVAAWIPNGVLVLVAGALLKYYAGQFISRLEKLEQRMEEALKEAARRVTLEDHRATADALHTRLNVYSERLAGLQTEMRVCRATCEALHEDAPKKRPR